jgi:spermidine synthase
VIFLLGLGFGGFFYRAALRLGRAEWNLALCQLGIAILALLAIGCEQLVLTTPWLRDQLSIFSVEFRSHSWPWRLGVSSVLSLAIMLPATLWMGLSFPLASVGLAYLISNLGSILGAVTAAVFIIRVLGTVDGTRLLAGLNLALGLLIAWRAPISRMLHTSALAAIALTLGIGFALPDRLDFRGESWLGVPDPRRLFEEEAELGTVQVLEQRAAVGERAMSIDGVPIGVTPGYDRDLYAKQVLLAHLPMLLDREIQDTLNVGLATASTLDAVSRYPWVETLDAVEINPSVIRAASFFRYSEVFEDPRVAIQIEDAVHYLLRTSKTYDLIINDAKQDVEFAGNAKILSREFYEHSLARLERCGIFAQWIPLISSAEAFEMISRTFMRVFPRVEFFVDPPTSAIMVGSRCPIAGRRRPTPAELEELRIAVELRSISLPDPLALPTLWAASGADLRAHLGPGPLNSWNRMRLEFIAYRSARAGPSVIAGAAGNLRLLAAARERGSGETPEFAESSLLESMFRLQEAWVQILGGRLAAARILIDGVLREHPNHAPARKAARVVLGTRADEM